jgi:hypothetical protein
MDILNVFDYFTDKLGRAPSPTYHDEFRGMPTDSVCGADCVKAIDAAHAFRESVMMAYGDGEEFKCYADKHESVRVLCEEVCGVFICG